MRRQRRALVLRPSWFTRGWRRAALALSIAGVACAAARLEPGPEHPASLEAEAAPLPSVGAAVAGANEPSAPAPTTPGAPTEKHERPPREHDAPPAHAGHEQGAADEDAAQRWTCPMHPQVLEEQPGKCPICGMSLVPVEPKSNR